MVTAHIQRECVSNVGSKVGFQIEAAVSQGIGDGVIGAGRVGLTCIKLPKDVLLPPARRGKHD